MTVKTRDGSGLALWRGLRAAALAVVAVLLVACGGDSDCTSPPAFEGGQVGECIDDGGGGGGVDPGAPTAADLSLVLSAPSMANIGSSTITATATAVDSNRNALAAIPITISVDSSAVATVSDAITNDQGVVTATVSTGADRSNRIVTVSAISGSLTRTATFQITGAKLSGALGSPVIEPGKSSSIRYRLLDTAGNPMAGQNIQVVAPGFTPSEATGQTGTSGEFLFTYAAPTATGRYDVTASAGGAADAQVVEVQTASTVPIVTEAITSASVSANPSVVGTNLVGASNNRSEIRALFLGANNRPIKNVRVRFDLDNDVNSIGGEFATGSATLYTDVNGVATTSYVPSTRSSPTDGVTVRACYGVSDTDPNLVNCSTSTKVSLTVSTEPLGVSIGTNELIIVNELTYVKKFVITVVDAAGVAKPDVTLVASVDIPQYRKGHYQVISDRWTKVKVPGVPPVLGDRAVCANEDVNRNGVLEAGENINGGIPYPDGTFNTRLDPGKSDVSVSLLQSKTRTDGTAELQLQYAKSFATWVDVKITVAASGVSGTEGRATYFVAPIPADSASINNKDVAPAYALSPYGDATSCADPN
jgi:hypothetical protein